MHGTQAAAELVAEMKIQEEEEARKEWLAEIRHANINALASTKIRKPATPYIGPEESYCLTPKIRKQVLAGLGVPEDWVQLDLFASEQNASHPVYITKQMDAFTYNWAELLSASHQVLWVNPPPHHIVPSHHKNNSGTMQGGFGYPLVAS